MIQAKELRIGNWVINRERYWSGKSTQFRDFDANVLEIFEDKLKINVDMEYQDYSCIHPIPLTKDILLKCGFKDRASFNEVIFESAFTHYSIILMNEKYHLHCEDEDEHFNFRIESLHQLQNLYFALTGKELEVEL